MKQRKLKTRVQLTKEIESLEAENKRLSHERNDLCDQRDKLSTECTAFGYAIRALRAECGLDRNSECFSDVAHLVNDLKRKLADYEKVAAFVPTDDRIKPAAL